MAGTTYRGLTIRIGADTTQFNAGLARINAAAAATTTQLRRIKTALKLDPGNTGAFTQQLGGMANLAAQTQAKISRLNEAMRELSRQTLSSGDGTVGSLAKGTQDAQYEAQKLQEAYEAVTTELARTYNTIEKITGVKLDTDSLTEGTKGYAENIQRLEEFLGKYGRTVEDVDLDTEKLAQTFVDLTRSEEDGSRVTQAMADHVVALRRNFNDTASAMEDMGRAAQLKDAESELARLNAEARSLARELVLADKSSAFSKTSSNIKAADRNIGVLDASLKAVDARLAQVDAALKLDPGNVVLAAQKAQLLAEREDVAAQKAEQLRAKLAAYDSVGIDKVASRTVEASTSLEKAKEAAAQAQEKVASLSGELRELSMRQKNMDVMDVDKSSDAYVRLATRVRAVKDDLRDAQQQARETGGAFDTAKAVDEYKRLQTEIEETAAKTKEVTRSASGTGSLRSIGYGLYTTVTPFLRSIGSSAIESAKDVDSAYRDMRKTVDGTEQQFEQLRDSAVRFSETHVTSADQILEIEAMGGQLGVSADKLQGFAEVVSNLDIATDIDAETAAKEVGQLANIMDDLQDATGKMDVGRVRQFSDALVRLGNNEPAMESDIMDVTMRLAGMSNIVGMSTPQLLAWSTAIVATGQNSEAAGTAISKTMSDIETAVGKGGAKLAKFAEVSGMSVDQFKSSWDTNASGTMLAFVNGLKKIDDAGGSVDVTLRALGISSVRQKQALMGLSQTTDVLTDSLSMANSAWADGGDAAAEAQKKAEGFSGAMQILSNNAQAAGAELAESIAPVVSTLAGALGDLTGKFSELPQGTKTAIVAIGGIVAAAGPVIVAVSAVKEGIDKLRGGAGLIGAVSGKASAGLGKLAGAMGITTSAAGLAVGAIATLVAVVGVAQVAYDEAQRKQSDFYDNLSQSSDIAKATGELDKFSGSIEHAGELSVASSKSIQDFRDSVADYTNTQKKVLEDYQGEVASLNTAQSVIDSFIGKTGLTAAEQSRLEWAIEQVNTQLGLNIDKQDVANGKYEDASGSVRNLSESLSDLISKKKEEARADALKEGLTNAYKAEADATVQLTSAQKEYNDAVAEETANQEKLGYSHEQAVDNAQLLVAANGDLKKKVNEASAALDSARGDVEAYSSQMGIASESTEKGKDAFVDLINSIGAFPQSILDANGQSVQKLADSLKDMGAKTDELQKLTDEDWKKIVMSYDGSAGSIAGALLGAGVSIDNYNAKDLSDKEASVNVDDNKLRDAQGNVYTWNGTELQDKDGNAVVDDVKLVDAQGRVWVWNGTKLKDQAAKAVVTGNAADGTAQGQLKDTKVEAQALATLNGSKVNVSVNVLGANAVSSLLGNLHSMVSRTWEAKVSAKTGNAAGGVRLHATGAIFTKATAISPTDVIGEAGAEYYDGTHIVPLTNRRYSQPFVDLIAEGVAGKVGMGGTTVVNNVYFDGVRINDDPQIRDVTKDYMMDLTRKAGMYR